MKKVLLIIVSIICFVCVDGQNYENIKNMGILQQFRNAKNELDKNMGDAKFISKPEAYILKTFIYAGLALDNSVKGTTEADQLLGDGDAAFKKYKQMDPSLLLVNDPAYQSGIINLYSGFYTAGYNQYIAKKWETSYTTLTKAVEYSDLLIEKKLLATSLDTNVLILAGITAENSGHKNDAAKLYSRMADNKLKGEGFESVYRFLVSYYFTEKNYTEFEKYKAIGHELYPSSGFFNFDKIDFAVGLESDFSKKMKALNEVLAIDPNNFKANEVLGEIIYDTLNPRSGTPSQLSDAAVLEDRMVAAFNKAAALNPGYENPYIYIGDHFINKAVQVDNERVAFAAEMKKHTQPGMPNSKEDVNKRDLLDKKYGDALEKAREPYENAVAIFAKKTTLKQQDKAQYKKAVSYLIDIASFKKITAKNLKSPDAAKFEEEEKKWTSLWESIK